MKTIHKFGILGVLLILLMAHVAASVNINSCGSLNNPNTEYILTTDLTPNAATNCIVIDAPGITLSCYGHSITSTNPSAAGYAIYISSSKNNVTIENCVITNFYNAIRFSNTYSSTSDFISLQHNTITNAVLFMSGYTQTLKGKLYIENNNFVSPRSTTCTVASPSSFYCGVILKAAIGFSDLSITGNYFDTGVLVGLAVPAAVQGGGIHHNYFFNGRMSDLYGGAYGYRYSPSYNSSTDGNYWNYPAYNFSSTCSSTDGVHCDDNYTVYYYGGSVVISEDHYPLVLTPFTPNITIDDISACGGHKLCFSFRDNETTDLITDGAVSLLIENTITHAPTVYISDSNGRVIIDTWPTDGTYTATTLHTKYFQASYSFNVGMPYPDIAYTFSLIPLTSVNGRVHMEFNDIENTSNDLSALGMKMVVAYDLNRCRSYYSSMPSCCIASAENTRTEYTLGVYNNITVESPTGCLKMGVGSPSNWLFYDQYDQTETQYGEYCFCSTSQDITRNFFLIEEKIYSTITGTIKSCANWNCVRNNLWTNAVGVLVSIVGDAGYTATTATNASGGFIFGNVPNTDYYTLSWYLTGYESGQRKDYLGVGDNHFPNLYLRPIITAPTANFTLYGRVTYYQENGTLDGLADVDIFGVYTTVIDGVERTGYLNALTNYNGSYSFSFETNRYPQPVTLDFNSGAYPAFSTVTKSVIISNTSSGRNIRIDALLNELTYKWVVIIPIDPSGCDIRTDPACLIPDAMVTCQLFNGTDCSSRSWNMTVPQSGVVTIDGLDCGDYTFKVESEYAAARTFNLNVPCYSGVHDLLNGTFIAPPVIVTPTKKVAWIVVNTWNNWTTDPNKMYIGGARVTLCSESSGECESKVTASDGSVKFLKDQGTYLIRATANGFLSCTIKEVGGPCTTSDLAVTTPPNQYVFLRFVEATENNDFWAWLESANILGFVQIFILLAVCLALIKIAREFGG